MLASSARAQSDGEVDAESPVSPQASAASDAGDEEARVRFEMARSLVASGELELAHRSFLDGYVASRRPLFVFNMAECSLGLERRDRARREYAEYLRLDPGGTQADAAQARLGALGPGDRSRPEYLVLEAHEPRGDEEPAPEAEAGPEPETETDELVAPAADLDPPEQRGDSGSRIATGPIVLAAAGGAMLVTGIALGLAANNAYNDLEGACDVDRVCDEANRDDLTRLRVLGRSADVFLFAGGGVALGGLLWWLLRPDEDTEVNVGLGSVSVRGTF